MLSVEIMWCFTFWTFLINLSIKIGLKFCSTQNLWSPFSNGSNRWYATFPCSWIGMEERRF
jgi:hypothetical protein